jgi:DNA-binding NtrC family response regulator
MNKNVHILIVENDDLLGESLKRYFSKHYNIDLVRNIKDFFLKRASKHYDVILLDVKLPDGEGIDLLPQIDKELTKVIVMTAYPEIQMAVKTLKMGAFDYINKPFELEDLKFTVDRAVEILLSKQKLEALSISKVDCLCKIIGETQKIKDLKNQIKILAQADDTNVLITGETGTGKELAAEAIHELSSRNNRPFVRINCSSIPANIFESELFGYEKGAFTDAKNSKKGFVEIAQGGTIFFDEIGELPVEIQPKILRFLENKTFFKLGSVTEKKADVRVIAATNRNISDMASKGDFRKDLFYRLNVVNLVIPPLRERIDDIPLIASYYLEYYATKMNKKHLKLTDEEIKFLKNKTWHGNIRELKNMIERYVIFETFENFDSQTKECMDIDDVMTLEELERKYILKIYEANDRNKTKTAELLNISRLTLRNKLKEYGID